MVRGSHGTAAAIADAMFKLITLSALCAVFYGCTPDITDSGTMTGQHATYVDSNGDGITDGVDTNGDGKIDYHTPNCPSCHVGGSPICDHPLIDTNGDGIPDGLDLDCDGVIDIPFDFGGSGSGSGSGSGGGSGGGTSQCISIVDDGTTKHEISCTSDGTGPATCECKVDDQVTSTCMDPNGASCSIGGGATNCCGF